MNIIALDQKEFAENVDFSLSLASKGHTLKITTPSGIVLLISPVASEVRDPENPEILQILRCLAEAPKILWNLWPQTQRF